MVLRIALQKEAMWMSFGASSEWALRIGIGGVDCVSGSTWEGSQISMKPQNYVVPYRTPTFDCIVPNCASEMCSRLSL